MVNAHLAPDHPGASCCAAAWWRPFRPKFVKARRSRYQRRLCRL